jgi:hypothetical protein
LIGKGEMEDEKENPALKHSTKGGGLVFPFDIQTARNTSSF